MFDCSEDLLEVKIKVNTFQQKTRVRTRLGGGGETGDAVEAKRRDQCQPS